MYTMFEESVSCTLLEQPSESIFNFFDLEWFYPSEQVVNLNQEAVRLFCYSFLKEYVEYDIWKEEILFDKSFYAYKDVLFLKVCRKTSQISVLCSQTYTRFLETMLNQRQQDNVLFVFNYPIHGLDSNLFLDKDGTICKIISKKQVSRVTIEIEYEKDGETLLYRGFGSNRLIGHKLVYPLQESSIIGKNIFTCLYEPFVKDQFGYVVFNFGKEEIDG